MSTRTDPVKTAIIEARRAQIMDAAVEVFAEKGFDNATVKDVAKAAGVADGTIYNYFRNKKDLLVSMISQLAEIGQFTDQTSQLSEDASPEEIVRFVVKNRLELLEKHQTRTQAILPQVLNNATLRSLFFKILFQPTVVRFEKIWQTQADKGQIRQISPEVVVRSMMSIFFGAVLIAYLGDSFIRNNTDEFVDSAIDLMLYGLLPRSDETEAAASSLDEM